MTDKIETDLYTLILGDCLEIMPTLAAGVDVIIVDPPYGLGFKYNSFIDTRENLACLISDFMPIATGTCEKVFVLPGITQITMYPDSDWIGCVTWNTTGSFGKYGFTQWMPILCYGKDIKGFGSVNDGVLKSDVIKISGGGGVGFMRGDEKENHPCPKPLNIMTQIINRYTNYKDTILDPMMGSGTTIIAALQTGRRAIGIEKDPQYFEIAAKRIATAAAQLRLEI
jgi:DNA modification methylase